MPPMKPVYFVRRPTIPSKSHVSLELVNIIYSCHSNRISDLCIWTLSSHLTAVKHLDSDLNSDNQFSLAYPINLVLIGFTCNNPASTSISFAKLDSHIRVT